MDFNKYKEEFSKLEDIRQKRELILKAFWDDDINSKQYSKLFDKYIRQKPAPRNNELRDN